MKLVQKIECDPAPLGERFELAVASLAEPVPIDVKKLFSTVKRLGSSRVTGMSRPDRSPLRSTQTPDDSTTHTTGSEDRTCCEVL